MKFRKDIKIKFSEEKLPEIMFAVVSEDNVPEIIGSSQNFKESYLMLFSTEKETQYYIYEMSKNSWFRARKNRPVKIKTTLKKYKSRYVPIEYAFANMK